MAAWGDEKSHVTRSDAAAVASRCSPRFQTRLTRRAPRRGGTRVNTIGAEQKLCPFFPPAQPVLGIVLILMPLLIFHFGGAERGGLVPALTNNSTDSWRALLARRSQTRKSSAVQTSTLIDQQQRLYESRHLCSEAANVRRPVAIPHARRQ